MEERKTYPLSREQQGLVDLFGFYPDQQILNICVRIHFLSEVREELLLRALELMPALLPYARLRIHQQDENTAVQYLSEEPPEKVEILSLEDKSDEEVDALFDSWGHELFPNNCRDVQLYKCRLLHLSGGRRAMFFSAHHFIMDAYAVINTVQTIDRIYSSLLKGTPLPKPAPEPWKLLEQERAYYSSPRFEADKAWWAETLRQEPHFTSLNGLGSPEFIEGRRYGKGQDYLTQLKGKRLERLIPAELVSRVNAASAERRISAQLLYLLALRSYLGRVSDTEDVIVDTAVARRSTLVQKQSGLTRANALPFRSILPESMSFDAALKELDRLQKEMYRHADVLLNDFFEVLDGQHDTPLGCTYHTTWLTYQPYFDLSGSELDFTASSLHSGAAAAPLYVYITPCDKSGSLVACYDVCIGYIKDESVDRFHAFMLRFIDLGLSAPETPLGELIDRSL